MHNLLSDHKRTELVTDEEFEILCNLLKLMRDKRQWMSTFMQGLSFFGEDGHTPQPKRIIYQVIQDWFNDAANTPEHDGVYNGVLACIAETDGYDEITLGEFHKLRDYLYTLRGSYWFAERVSLECEAFVEGQRFAPTEIIQHIIGAEVGEFECAVLTTEAMLRDFPAMFQTEGTVAKTPASAPVSARNLENERQKDLTVRDPKVDRFRTRGLDPDTYRGGQSLSFHIGRGGCLTPLRIRADFAERLTAEDRKDSEVPCCKPKKADEGPLEETAERARETSATDAR